jgi:hypothetical protein
VAEGILYDNSLIDSFEKSLSSAFNRSVRLSRKGRKQTGAFLAELIDGDTYAHTNEGTEWIVCEIRNSENQPTGFYFSFVATFERRTFTNYTLQHSSLQVFHNLGDLIPLFRAEWSQEATLDQNSDHAQPHWHFVQRPERVEEVVRSKMIEEIVRAKISLPTEFIPAPKSQFFTKFADSGKFHFAMSPLWEANKTVAHKQDFESANFPIWFDNLTKYVASQIAYIVMKAPPLPAKDFVPEEPSA